MALFKLTAKQVMTLGDGFHSDGGNLYLRVRGNARSWIFRYRTAGKSTDIGLGPVRVVSLRAAREKAAVYRAQLDDAVPPLLAKMEERQRKAKAAAMAARHPLNTFYEEAVKYYVTLKGLRGRDAVKDRVSRLERYALPHLGSRAIETITTGDIAGALRGVWGSSGSGVKVLASLRCCYLYGAMKGWVTKPFATDWKGGLEAFLPALKASDKHHGAVPWEDMPEVYVKLAEGDGIVRDLMLATILCATRLGELGRMESTDIDLDRHIIYVRHRKDGRKEPFVVPFPLQCLPMFSRAKERIGEAFPVDRTALLKRLRRCGIEATMHGFRATFSTWCADNEKDPVLREMCLCHRVESTVALAYQRSDRLEPRRRLLQEWADYVTRATS